jgi:hypothetical protein
MGSQGEEDMRSFPPKQVDTSTSSGPLALRAEENCRDQPQPEAEFQVSFKFVQSVNSHATLNERRSHVMRQFRRRQRWEREQKKHQTKQIESSSENEQASEAECYRPAAFTENTGRERVEEPMSLQFEYSETGSSPRMFYLTFPPTMVDRI